MKNMTIAMAFVALSTFPAFADATGTGTGTGIATGTAVVNTTTNAKSATVGSNTANDCVFGIGAGVPGEAAVMINIPLGSCRISREADQINRFTAQVTGSAERAGSAALEHLAKIPRVKRTLQAQGLLVDPAKPAVSTKTMPTVPAAPVVKAPRSRIVVRVNGVRHVLRGETAAAWDSCKKLNFGGGIITSSPSCGS